MNYRKYIMLSLLCCFSMMQAFGQRNAPFTIVDGLFNQDEPDSLGLTTAMGTETVTVFSPTAETNQFSNGAVLAVFKGKFYCQWQSSMMDEDAADTYVAYSVSDDGTNWSEPMILASSIDNGYASSGGWWSTSDTLVGYINTWPSTVSPRGGYTQYVTSIDGNNWSAIQPLTMLNGDTLKGIFEQDPHALPGGRIINAAHFQPGLVVSPIFTDDPTGIRGWVRATFENTKPLGSISREIEPSWFLRNDEVAVMVFRDQDGTYQKLASISADQGATWTTPVLTNMPDSRSKQSAGNFPDGTAFMVSNPVDNRLRIPLVVTLSRDGQIFNQAYVLRKGGDGIQPLRFEGRAKRLGYHYPKSLVYNDTLYVAYTTNKEDVEITRVPIENLIFHETSSLRPYSSIDFQVFNKPNKSLEIVLSDIDLNLPNVFIYNALGETIYNGELAGRRTMLSLSRYPTGNYFVSIIQGSKRGVQKVILR